MSDGFLGRWSKRKLAIKEGKPPQAEPQQAVDEPPKVATARALDAEPVGPTAPLASSEAQAPAEAQEKPPLTLDDVKALTSESDFSLFAARDVAPEVKNAAMKKLFSDPRYNVMDGMDVYVGDYSQPDPIPHAMLRQLASAKFLGLFDQEEKEEAAARAQQEGARAQEAVDAAAADQPRDVADNPTAQSVAQSEPPPPAVPEPPDHADPDLRLQQDDAPAGEDPGAGDR